MKKNACILWYSVLYVLFKTQVEVFYHILRHDAKRSVLCFMGDKTRLTSVLNDFKNISVGSPHWQGNVENQRCLN